MYSKQYFIGSNDVDFNLELKISSLFKILQDIAVEHAEKLGVGKKKTMDIGMAWVITRFKVNILTIPKYQQTIVARTYPCETKKFIFPRNFLIEDLNGNVLVEASSTWIVINGETRRICLNPFPDFIFPSEQYENEISSPEKVPSNDSTLIEERLVRYSDTDLNGHMNNTRYIDFITDLHNISFYKEKRIKTILINYNKELRNDDLVKLYSSNGNPEYIKGEVNGQNVFDVLLSFVDR